MKRYITVDGGTTNTRVFLVEDGMVKDSVKIPIGTRVSIEDKTALPRGIKDAVNSILTGHSLSDTDITAIIASGMITSEHGLCPLDHIIAPAGIAELNATMYKTEIPEISGIPFYFIRGVKLLSDSALDTDMMRGEETELMGALVDGYRSAIYVFPGSHSKVIRMSADNKIEYFSTHMTGEMIYALSQHTILKGSVDLSVSEIDTDALVMGCEMAEREGVNKALFKTRVMKTLFGASDVSAYSFFFGVVLCDEIKDILSSGAETVVIGGREQIKRATADIIRRKSEKRVIELSECEVASSVALGAVKIFEYQK